MKTYDVKCPVCGHMNYSLFLEETDGWMECEKCKSTTKSMKNEKTVRIPVIQMKQMELHPSVN